MNTTSSNTKCKENSVTYDKEMNGTESGDCPLSHQEFKSITDPGVCCKRSPSNSTVTFLPNPAQKSRHHKNVQYVDNDLGKVQTGSKTNNLCNSSCSDSTTTCTRAIVDLKPLLKNRLPYVWKSSTIVDKLRKPISPKLKTLNTFLENRSNLKHELSDSKKPTNITKDRHILFCANDCQRMPLTSTTDQTVSLKEKKMAVENNGFDSQMISHTDQSSKSPDDKLSSESISVVCENETDKYKQQYESSNISQAEHNHSTHAKQYRSRKSPQHMHRSGKHKYEVNSPEETHKDVDKMGKTHKGAEGKKGTSGVSKNRTAGCTLDKDSIRQKKRHNNSKCEEVNNMSQNAPSSESVDEDDVKAFRDIIKAYKASKHLSRKHGSFSGKKTVPQSAPNKSQTPPTSAVNIKSQDSSQLFKVRALDSTKPDDYEAISLTSSLAEILHSHIDTKRTIFVKSEERENVSPNGKSSSPKCDSRKKSPVDRVRRHTYALSEEETDGEAVNLHQSQTHRCEGKPISRRSSKSPLPQHHIDDGENSTAERLKASLRELKSLSPLYVLPSIERGVKKLSDRGMSSVPNKSIKPKLKPSSEEDGENKKRRESLASENMHMTKNRKNNYRRLSSPAISTTSHDEKAPGGLLNERKSSRVTYPRNFRKTQRETHKTPFTGYKVKKHGSDSDLHLLDGQSHIDDFVGSDSRRISRPKQKTHKQSSYQFKRQRSMSKGSLKSQRSQSLTETQIYSNALNPTDSQDITSDAKEIHLSLKPALSFVSKPCFKPKRPNALENDAKFKSYNKNIESRERSESQPMCTNHDKLLPSYDDPYFEDKVTSIKQWLETTNILIKSDNDCTAEIDAQATITNFGKDTAMEVLPSNRANVKTTTVTNVQKDIVNKRASLQNCIATFRKPSPSVDLRNSQWPKADVMNRQSESFHINTLSEGPGSPKKVAALAAAGHIPHYRKGSRGPPSFKNHVNAAWRRSFCIRTLIAFCVILVSVEVIALAAAYFWHKDAMFDIVHLLASPVILHAPNQDEEIESNNTIDVLNATKDAMISQ